MVVLWGGWIGGSMAAALAESASAPSAFPVTLCAICGNRGPMPRGEQRSIREGFACPHCRATLRYRDQAALILDEFGRGQFLSIDRLARSGLLDDISIYEPALGGPFVSRFKDLPNYRRSYYWDDGRPGDLRDGVPFEDLKSLSFADRSIDLVLTSDVLEHVIEPELAFKEISRVLKVGGVHIFSIPTAWPLPDRGTSRVEIIDDEIHNVLTPRYHRAGDGAPSLVITDFGANIIDLLSRFGMKTQIVRRSLPIDAAYQNATFICRRMS
jgi:SAM-dependent methyltransferase